MTDDKDKHSQESPDLDDTPLVPNTDGLSLVEDEKQSSPLSVDFDFDLDDDLAATPGQDQMAGSVADTPAAVTEPTVDDLADKLDTTTEAETRHEQVTENPADMDSQPTADISDESDLEATAGFTEEFDLDTPSLEEPEGFEDAFPDDSEETDDRHDEDAEVRSDPGRPAEDEPTARKNALLAALGKPEQAVKNAYRNSSLRAKLLQQFKWYRVRDEDSRMEDILEETYGGAAKQKFKPGTFFKNNILATLLILVVSVAIVSIGTDIYFAEPAARDVSAEKIVKKTITPEKERIRVKKKKTEQKPVAVAVVKKPTINTTNKGNIQALLQHCLILPKSRESIKQRFMKTDYEFSDRNLTLAHEEIKAFINTYEEIGLLTRVQDAIDRVGMLSHAVVPVITDVRNTVSVYRKELGALQKQATKINKQLETLNRGRQSTTQINQKIKLRSDLDKLNDKLAKSPTIKEFALLYKAIISLETGLTGDTQLKRINIEAPEEELPQWFVNLPDSGIDSLRETLKETVLPKFTAHADALEPGQAELSSFHIRELTLSLEKFYLLASHIMYAPENLLNTYNIDLNGANNRLRRLLDKDQDEWLSFEPCVQQARLDAVKAR